MDAGFNKVRKVDRVSAEETTLTSFAPTPNPQAGPPFIENVPTTIRWNNGQLLVTLLAGAPFLPGLSQVRQVDPISGVNIPLIQGLSAAVDVAPLTSGDGVVTGFFTLEFDLNFPAPGPGRLQFFSGAGATPVVLTDCLTTASSLLWDRKNERVVITDLATGRLVTLESP